jgi:hypothetical protein
MSARSAHVKKESNMKVMTYTVLFLAGVALTSLSHGAPTGKTRACINAFVAENTPPNTPVDVRVNEYVPPMPLELRDAMTIRLQAVEKTSGKTIAEADCRVKSGEVSITQL